MKYIVTISTDASRLVSTVNDLDSLVNSLDPDFKEIFSSAFDGLVSSQNLSVLNQFDKVTEGGIEIGLIFTPSPELNELIASVRNTVQTKELIQHSEKTKFSADQLKSALGICSDVSARTKSRNAGDVHSDLSLQSSRNNSRLNKLVDLVRAAGNKVFIKFIRIIFRLRNFRKKLADHN